MIFGAWTGNYPLGRGPSEDYPFKGNKISEKRRIVLQRISCLFLQI